MRIIRNSLLLVIAAVFFTCGPVFLSSCGDPTVINDSDTVKTVVVKKFVPDFNADSAYAFIKAQVDFGPRVPGTPGHEKCLNYIVAKMKSYGMEVTVQNGSAIAYNGKTMPV